MPIYETYAKIEYGFAGHLYHNFEQERYRMNMPTVVRAPSSKPTFILLPSPSHDAHKLPHAHMTLLPPSSNLWPVGLSLTSHTHTHTPHPHTHAIRYNVTQINLIPTPNPPCIFVTLVVMVCVLLGTLFHLLLPRGLGESLSFAFLLPRPRSCVLGGQNIVNGRIPALAQPHPLSAFR